MGGNASLVACPLHTELPTSLYEHRNPLKPCGDVRAYKWSYNAVELRLSEGPGGKGRAAAVQHVVHADGARFSDAHAGSAVSYHVQLESGAKLQAHVYLCYDLCPSDEAAEAAPAERRGPTAIPGSAHFAWNLVTRAHCCKGCEGRVLRSIQRFGRLGKRAAGASEAKPAAEGDAAGSKRKVTCCPGKPSAS